MKKLLFFIPISLLALSSTALLTLEYSKPDSKRNDKIIEPQNPSNVFSEHERIMRQILRYGDEKSLEHLYGSLDKLDGFLGTYSANGLDTTKADDLILNYVQDSIIVSKVAPNYIEEIHTTHQFESSNKRKFLASLDQIGLYELKDSFEKLEKSRLEYLKNPKVPAGNKYIKHFKEVRTIIAELYLDDAIESPLFTYLDNHMLYFKTVAHMYQEIGEERIIRLRFNGYAIQTQLELLPKI